MSDLAGGSGGVGGFPVRKGLVVLRVIVWAGGFWWGVAVVLLRGVKPDPYQPAGVDEDERPGCAKAGCTCFV